MLTGSENTRIWLLLIGLGAAGGLLAAERWAAGQVKEQTADGAASIAQGKAGTRPPAADGDKELPEKLKELLGKRLMVAQKMLDIVRKRFLAGSTSADDVYPASLRVLEAELDLCMSRAQRVKACENHLERMVEVDDVYRARLAKGLITGVQAGLAEFHRLDAQIRLEREKAK